MALEGIIQAAEKQGIDKSTILNDIQKKYAKYVKDRQQFYEIESLQEMTGVKPDEKLIQETYSNYIKGFSISYDDKALDDIKELIKITEIKPKFPPEEDIQAIYAGCIREGKLDCIEKLEKITRIKLKVPPEKKIQQTYMEYLKVDYSGKGWDSDGAATLEKIDKIAELEKITGIKFKIPPEEKIQQTYMEYMREGLLYGVVKLEKMTGIKPKLPSEKEIQHIYAGYTRGKFLLENLDIIEKLEKMTGIKPKLPQEEVQNAYANLAKLGWFNVIPGLEELTGISPSEEIYKQIVKYLHTK